MVCLRSRGLFCRCTKPQHYILDKLYAITKKITIHDASLFTEGDKLKTGLNCLHNFNDEKRHYFKSGVEKDVLRLVEDLDRVMAKYILSNLYQFHNMCYKMRDKKKEKRGNSQLVKTEEK